MIDLHAEKYINDEEFEWLVLLHGLGGSTKMWLRQIKMFKSKYNLLLIDLPGHGKSKDGIKDKSVLSFSDIGDLVVAKMKEEGIIRATFMCVSLGTLVFAGILRKHSEVVGGAILCGAISGMNKFLEVSLKTLSKIQSFIPYMFIMRVASFVLLPKKGHKFSRNFFIRASKVLGQSEFNAWCKLCIKDMHVLKSIPLHNQDILFVMGNEDYTFIKGVKKKVEKFKSTTLKIIENCGHVCNIQKHNEFNNIVLEYMEGRVVNEFENQSKEF